MDGMKDNYSHKTDAQCYAMLQSNNRRDKEAGFTELYKRHSQRIYQYCRRFTGNNDTASDVLQETFLRFLSSAERGATMTNIPAFLLRIARNLCIDARKRQSQFVISSEIMELPAHDAPMESQELRHLLIAALDALPEDHKEAIVLQAYNGMSYQEISEATSVPVTTVRNWIVRGKKKLREILAPYIKELEK
jgi:RNA polymerase sigma-70 factor (ECF subfamily)